MLTINFWFWILFAVLTILTIITWVTSFSTPRGVENPFTYLMHNQSAWMWTWFLLLILSIVISIIMFAKDGLVGMKHPFTHQGVFLFCFSALLLSSFFINVDGAEDKRIYKNHPIIFFTSAYFLFMALIISISVNFKLRNKRKYKLLESDD